MKQLALLVLALLTALGSVTTFASDASAAPVNPRSMLIVATHTDDEATALPYFTGPNYAGIRKYILWVDETRGGNNTALNAQGLPRLWNTGEYKPAGDLTTDQARSNGKFRGSIMNLQYLRNGDPNIPIMNYDRPTKKFSEGGRDVMTWMDSTRGGAIRYDIPTASLSAVTVRNAINDVTRNPTKFGIPAGIVWTDLMAAEYYNYSGDSSSSCLLYQHPAHKKTHDGVRNYQYRNFTGWKIYTVCQKDPGARTKYLAPAVQKYSHPYRGSFNYYFGWLYAGYGVKPLYDKSGVFSNKAAVTVGRITSGVANP